MKKLLFIVFWAFLVPSCVNAQERITSFDVDVVINADATVDVVETISYDFGGKERRGIFREIPYKYKARGGNYSLRYSDIFVTDENGQKRNVEMTHSGGILKIKIGEGSVYADPQEIYKIHYRADRALNYFDAHDELYWNVTGDEWDIPIEKASAVISVAGGTALSQGECFVGPYGSTEKCNFSAGRFASRALGAGEGFTIVAGVPKGVVVEPSFMQRLLWILKDNIILALPIAAFLMMWRVWYTRGKDPRAGTVVPQWEIPDDLTPLECGLLIDEKIHRHDTSSLFIDLAIRKYFTIKKMPKEGIFGKEDFKLTKLKEWGVEVTKAEKLFLDGVFYDNKTAKISSLKNSFYKDIARITKESYEYMSVRGYFVKNPSYVRGLYFGIGVAAIFVGVWLGAAVSAISGVYGIVALVSCGVIIIGFSFVMPKRTKEGVKTRDQILGLKMYMEAAEERRIKMFDDPDKLPPMSVATFEKYLPYAMVLGVEDQWSEKFEDIYRGKEPSWYQGGGPQTPRGLSDTTKGFAAAAGAIAASQPSSSSSGGSGFSGGGSGGGGGGGGGGSW